MKATGITIKRRVITTVSALVATLILSGSVSALAYPLDHEGSSGPALPAAPHLATETGGSGSSWVIALIVAVVVVAVAAALIGTVRVRRIRTRAVAAGF